MSSPLLKLRYRVDSRPWSSLEAIDLAEGTVYRMTEPLGEYYGSVEFWMEVPSDATVRKDGASNDVAITWQDRRHCNVKLSQKHRGMVGVRRFSLRIQVGQITYPLDIVMSISPAGLTEEQFSSMLSDIRHWMFFAWSSPVTQDIGYTDRFDTALHSNLTILELIGQRIDGIEAAIFQMAGSPRSRIQKRHYVTDAPLNQTNAEAIRWSARHPGDLRSLDSRNVTTYDIYENQFVVFFLEQMKRRLMFFEAAASRTIQQKEIEIRNADRYGNTTEENKLEDQRRRACALREKSGLLRSRLDKLRQLEFLREVTFVPSHFQLTYSLALTQDFTYSRIFALYLELGRDETIKRLDRVVDFVDRLFTLGVEATHQIYEYWTFLAVFNELLRLHFEPKDGEHLLQMIASDSLVPRLQSGGSITLVGDDRLYGNMTLRLHYDKPYQHPRRKKTNPKEDARPDITLEIYRDGQLSARFLFDAKYKNYTDACDLNSANEGFWQKDFRQISSKYQNPEGGGVIDLSRGAFLFHANTRDKWYENYGAVVQNEEGGPWALNAHRYGFIPVVPGALTQLRTLLAMIFLVQLNVGFDLCWICGSTDVEHLPYRSQDGVERPNCRKCRRCGNEWWTNNCSNPNCRSPFFRGKFHFHVQHVDIDAASNCPGIVCYRCGRCFCRPEPVVRRIK